MQRLYKIIIHLFDFWLSSGLKDKTTMNEYIFKSNLKKRILATILDYGLFFLIFYVYLMYFGKPNNEGGYTVNGFAAIPIPIIWFCYFVLIEATMGATVGHKHQRIEDMVAQTIVIDLKDFEQNESAFKK